MRLETKNEGKVLVVRSLENRMDAKVAVDFKTEMFRFIDQGNKLIVLSIANVDFIDSSGLGAIVSVLKLIGHDGLTS
jgi:anti-sigma B factor antagonist